MPALYPMNSAPENFRPGDVVRKFVSEASVSPFVGLVSHIVPSTYKVWVEWPTGVEQEDPQNLIKVNPLFGLPTVSQSAGYDSYEKCVSEKNYGQLPNRMASESEKMAIRIAHTFATGIIGDLVEDVVSCHEHGMSDFQTYNQVFRKYSNTCSDHIIKFSIMKVYAASKKKKLKKPQIDKDDVWQAVLTKAKQVYGDKVDAKKLHLMTERAVNIAEKKDGDTEMAIGIATSFFEE